MKNTYLLLPLTLTQLVVFGQEKNKHTLFNPVPKDKMREMSTDRPDITESAKTVDAGHFQIETDLFKNTRNRNAPGLTAVENNYNLANLKLGITHNLGLQLIIGTFVNSYEKESDNSKINKSRSFGDLTLRAKYNVWGNDKGKTAFAIMPYLNLPTSVANNYIEAGVVFPLSIDLNNNFSLGSQIQFDILKSNSKTGYYGSLLQSVVIGKELTKKIEFFAESFYTYNLQEKIMQFSMNAGTSYVINDNFKIDAGFNLGMTKNTDKVYFIGFSFRY